MCAVNVPFPGNEQTNDKPRAFAYISNGRDIAHAARPKLSYTQRTPACRRTTPPFTNKGSQSLLPG